MIYLDNAATTFPKPENVYLAMDNANRNIGVNAGRGSYKIAQEASKLISDTKTQLRQLVHADSSSSVIFAPSITIAFNQIINGINWISNTTVYVSPYEHNAVARTINKVAIEKNLKIKQIPLDENTLEVDLEKLKYEFSKDKPFAVFCTHISNVTGYILPVSDIFCESKKYNAITIVDSAQSLGLIELDSKNINADIICFAGHKCLYGPFGIGGFINVTNVPLAVFLTGGTGSDSLNLNMPEGRETRYEASSSNIVAIAGLHAALECLDITCHREKERQLTDYLICQLSTIDKLKLYLPKNKDNHIGIVSFTHEELNSEDLGKILDEDFDIAVRTGYHCAPYIHSFLNDKQFLGTVRVGVSQYTSYEDIDALAKALKDIND
ncbi:aminotransferase class V-fold PLP-dependent enzyme [Lacrimispora saccharolytica]|uniref:aminotransferase class V-fold PLP-dependent enzyme n=1 Tax=Lacrimispora saccharolytica TaxID=84030 RepID=UPI00265D4BCB|nr:aminotransferase class V-fold PLP-dependent enzyme [Lacrimispora saccharolytica]MCF2657513.1 aminotransferase class V-fold PLP-dependent enzyme [Lacrimispora saccharolytica]